MMGAKLFPKHAQNTCIITVALKLLFDLPVCTKASRVEPNLNTAKQILARLRAAQPASELVSSHRKHIITCIPKHFYLYKLLKLCFLIFYLQLLFWGATMAAL